MPDVTNSDFLEAQELSGWVNPPQISDLRADLQGSQPYHDERSAEISGWLDDLNLEGAAKRQKIKGKSNIQPKLIRKNNEWRYAALSEPFLSTDKLFTVNPVTWADKPRALQNELLLNNQFDTDIDKVNFIDSYVRTAVNEGTVIVRVGWANEQREVVTRDPIYRFRLAEDAAEMAATAKLIELSRTDPEGFVITTKLFQRNLVNLFNQTGQIYTAFIDGHEEGTEIQTIRDHPTVEVLDYRNVYIDPSAGGNFDRAKFVIQSYETSYAELVKDGRYENLENVTIDPTSIVGDPDHTAPHTTFNFADRPRQRVVAYQYWGFWDVDETGETKPFVATFIGGTYIQLEESPFPDGQLPFVVVSYLPRRKEVYGEPDGALLKDNQDVIGALTRGMVDVMGRSAAGQKGIRKDALDAINRRRYNQGKDYEFNPTVDPRTAIIDHNYPELPSSTQFMLQLQNMEAESLTGVRAFGATNTTDLGDSATAARGALDAASKRELGILRRLSKGITDIGRKIIAMNALFLEESQVVRITDDEFVQISGDNLYGDYDVTLTITTAEEDAQKAQELSFMLQTMGNSMDFNLSKIILAEIARLRKMPVLSREIENFQPQPDPIAQQRGMLELELLRAQIAEVNSRALENQVDARLDLARTQSELAKTAKTQSEADMNNLRFIEQESGLTHARDLQRVGEQGRSNINLEVTKAALAQASQNPVPAPRQAEDEQQTNLS